MNYTCDDCGVAVTKEQYDRGDGFCWDCAMLHGVEEEGKYDV